MFVTFYFSHALNQRNNIPTRLMDAGDRSKRPGAYPGSLLRRVRENLWQWQSVVEPS